MEKTTCFNSITLLVLKELRLEKGIQSAYIAEQLGRTPSSWAKIENGKSAFPMDCLFQVSRALWTPASSIIGSAERYATLLAQHQWAILQSPLVAEEDLMLHFAQKYYESEAFKERVYQRNNGILRYDGFSISVLNSPIFHPNGSISIIDVFRYALDEQFRNEQNVKTSNRILQ